MLQLMDCVLKTARSDGLVCVENHGSSIETDEFCIRNDGFCIKNDEFCMKNDGFCVKNHALPRTSLFKTFDTDGSGELEVRFSVDFLSIFSFFIGVSLVFHWFFHSNPRNCRCTSSWTRSGV